MKLLKGDMFRDAIVDVILVTTNAFVKKDGSLVMGRGAAAQLAKMYPEIPYIFGGLIKQAPSRYGIILDTQRRGNRIYGAFQVKNGWFDKADPNLIGISTGKLATLAGDLFNWRFAVNFPGIGNGQLNREDVLPLIEYLPDNVEVWEY